MKVFCFFSFLLLSLSVIAGESTLPVGCHALRVQDETITLLAKKNKLVFIHNLTQADLWITHPLTEPNTDAALATRLEAGSWAALSLDKGPFILNCIESRPGHEQQVPCEGAVALCEWKKVGFPEYAKGVFWAAENMSLAALRAGVGARGFILP